MTELDISNHGYLIKVGGLFYQTDDTYKLDSSAEVDDPYQDPDAWYFFSVKQHWEVEKQVVGLFGRTYCRSWIGIMMDKNMPCRWYGSNGELLETKFDKEIEQQQQKLVKNTSKARKEKQRARRMKQPKKSG